MKDNDHPLKMYPKISIVTPSFNQGQFLERTIQSVINQGYPNLEYIIIDGGSQDDSIEIIKKYEAFLSFWVSEKDSGQSEALNKGFKKATGEIFAYINSDDIYLPGTLHYVSNAFLQDNQIDVIYGHALMIDENDRDKGYCIALPFKLKEHLNGIFAVPQPSAFWKKEVLIEVGYFNEKNDTCMDGEFFASALYKGFNFVRCKKLLSSFRIHADSKTGKTSYNHKKKYYSDELNYFNRIKMLSGIRINKFYKLFFRIKYMPIKLFFTLKFNLNG